MCSDFKILTVQYYILELVRSWYLREIRVQIKPVGWLLKFLFCMVNKTRPRGMEILYLIRGLSGPVNCDPQCEFLTGLGDCLVVGYQRHALN